jgi:alpha-tubulin suppressor-like RCC1 family protein
LDWANPTKSCYTQHYVTLKTDSTMWGWGSNANGELGNSTVVSNNSPIQIAVLSGVVWSSVGLGYRTTFAIDTSGRLWSWGQNSYGKLGLNDLIHRSSPVQVGANTNWSFVAGGMFHTVALKTDGTLWCWGQNSYGSLGNNTTINRSSSVQVGSATTWSKVCAGQNHSLAIKNDGTLWAWGRNLDGALGDGTTTNKSSPLQIGGENIWSIIQSTGTGGVAIKANGTLWAWGNNSNGTLGDGTTAHRSSPVQIGSDKTWTDIAVGQYAVVALKSDGTLWNWGYNGSMGNGVAANTSSPVQTLKADALWISIGSNLRNFFCVRGVTTTTTTPPPVTSGLTLWYKAEGYTSGSQTWTDNSTTNNTGTFIGTPPVYSTSPNKLAFVSSSGNQVTSINSFGLNANPWTISTWFRTFSPSGRKIIGMENVISGGNAIAFDSHIYVGTDGRLRYGIFEGAAKYLISPDVVTDNMFRNVTVTLGSGIGSMYINNKLVSSGSMTAGLYSGYWRVGGFSLGSGAWTGANTANGTFEGDIASVQVYNRVLSSGEIFQNYLNQNEIYNKLNTFNYTSANQTYTVPSGTTKLGINLKGATGARGAFNQSGGGGANVFTTLSVSSGQQFSLVVGGSATSGTPAYGFGGAGGFASGNVYIAGAGGGMAGVFTSGSINISGTIVVAAGGGGGAGINRAGYNYTGGDASLSLLSGGRGADGNEDPGEISRYGHNAGYGATTSGGGARGIIYDSNIVQPSSGILFSGGRGGLGNGSNGGGGGGAGYYGGGGGAGGGLANGGGGAGSTFFASGTLTYGGLNYSGHAKISIQAFN